MNLEIAGRRAAAARKLVRATGNLRWRRLTAPLAIFLIISAFYWKMTLTDQFDWMWNPDLAQQVEPWLQLQARLWHSGTVPLWDPTLWYGQPLLAQAQPGVAYPLNWFLFLLPLRDGHIREESLQWYFVSTRMLAALFCYLLCRDLRRSKPASIFAGIAFAVGGYIGFTGWPQLVNAAVWAPLILMFVLRVARGDRPFGSAALSGMFLGISWLSGHHQIPIFCGLSMAFLWLYLILRVGTSRWRMTVCAAVFLVFTLLTGALQIIPSYAFGHLAKRWVGTAHEIGWNERVPYSVHEHLALHPHNLLESIVPYQEGELTGLSLFVGLSTVALAVLGIAAGRSRREIKILSCFAAGAVAYAIGPWSFFQGLLYALIPDLDKARTPAMAIFLFSLSLSALAAYGFDSLRDPASDLRVRRTVFGLLILGCSFVLILGAQALLHNSQVDDFPSLMPLAAFVLAALLTAHRTNQLRWNALATCLLLTLMFELSVPQTYIFADRGDKTREKIRDDMRSNGDIAAWIASQPGAFRVETDPRALVANWGSMHGLEMSQGYLPSLTSNLAGLDTGSPDLRSAFGVRYSIASQPMMDGEEQVFEGASGLKVFRNKAAFPRGWIVHRVVFPPMAGHGISFNQLPFAEMRDLAVVKGGANSVGSCGIPDHVRITGLDASEIEFSVELACDGMLVVSNTWYPGWRATVDGKQTEVLEVNGAMQGVFVGKGTHSVEFYFEPVVVYVSGALSLAGLICAPLLWRSRIGQWGNPETVTTTPDPVIGS